MSGTQSTIGLIGTGRMGTAMAERLLDGGARLIIWNRSPDKAGALLAGGAVQASSPADVAAQAEAIIVIVRDDQAMEAVYAGAGGLCSASLAGRVVIDMTTATVGAMTSMAALVHDRGGSFIDAPVSGTVGPARNGQLLIMVGGTAQALDTVRPILEQLSRKIVHAGPVGAGITMKLAVNLPIAVYWEALGEALALGRAFGLDFATLVALIADSKAAIGSLGPKLPIVLGETDRVDFDLAGVAKDLTAMIDSATTKGVTLPTASAAAQAASRAVSAGWGGYDIATIVRYVAGLPRQS